MKQIPLKEFLEGRTQSEVAEIMGRSQGAVSQMLAAGRQIFITADESGNHGWFEIRQASREPDRNTQAR